MSEVLSLDALLQDAAEAFQQRRLPEAEELLRIAIAETPGRADALALLGTIRAQSDDEQEAIVHLRRACELEPEVAGYHNNLALALTGAGEVDAAIESYHKALELEPDSAFILINVGRLLRRVCRIPEAIDCFRRALALHPASPELKVYLADTLALSGEEQAAESLYRQVLQSRPDWANAWFALSSVRRFESENDRDLDAMCRLNERTGISVEEQCSLSFAIGKAYDDLGLYDLAFAHFERGNALHTQVDDPDNHREVGQIAEVMDVFDSALIERKKQFGNGSRKPVFIVGMPRAGKTLLEEQLACYRGVHAGGESAFVHVPCAEDPDGARLHYPHNIASLTGRQIEQTAAGLLDRIDRVAPDASRFINTMPGNFLTAGLIRILFPEATILHCVRDPRDTCLSCYFKLFAHGWSFTYDLAFLGRYYGVYARLMRHWQSVMGGMVEIRYEELVSDPERTVRRAAVACGLEDSDRIAPLAPLHAGGVARWRHYSAHLTPLIDALREGGGGHAGLTTP